MNSQATSKFWKLYNQLPLNIQRRARRVYQLWKKNSAHPSLHFKCVDDIEPIYSARIDNNYRVRGVRDQDTIIWYWIGTHDEYERLLR